MHVKLTEVANKYLKGVFLNTSMETWLPHFPFYGTAILTTVFTFYCYNKVTPFENDRRVLGMNILRIKTVC